MKLNKLGIFLLTYVLILFVSGKVSESVVDSNLSNETLAASPGMTITMPNGDEILQKTYFYNVTWKPSGGITGGTIIDLYRNGKFVRNLGNSSAQNGTFPFTVPSDLPTGDGYKIRIYRGVFPKIQDYSNNDFTIINPYFSVEAFPLPKEVKGYIQPIVPLDFDHDGDLDIVFGELMIMPNPQPWGNGLLFALRNDGHGHFNNATTAVFSHDTAICPMYGLVADYDRDGRNDLYILDGGSDNDSNSGGQNQLFLQSPTGRLLNKTETHIPESMDFTHSGTVGDIDADGDPDIFVGNIYCLYNCNRFPYLLINDGTGKFSMNTDRLPQDMIDLMKAGTKKYTASLFVDANKDGRLELILGKHPGGGWPDFYRDAMLLNDGTGHFLYAPDNSMPVRYGGIEWGIIQIISADFNRDSWPDLIMSAVNTDYSVGRVLLLLNNKKGEFSYALDNIPDNRVSTQYNYVGDFNRDGWPDLFVNSDVVGAKIFLNKGNALFTEVGSQMLPKIYQGEINIGKTVPCDVDGDGDLDFYGDGGGEFFLFRNLRPFNANQKTLSPPILQAPGTGATGLSTTVYLKWKDTNISPSEKKYQIRIKAEAGSYSYFDAPKNALAYQVSGLTHRKSYFWNVKAKGDGSNTKNSTWANSGKDWKFTTK
jgi:hypothetical protein